MKRRLRLSLLTWFVVAASALSGCALNAALEVEMHLPYEDGDLPRARVQVCGPDCEFGEYWDRPAQVIEIASAAPCETGGDCNARFSVVTEQTDLEQLRVQIRFCDTDCDLDVAAPGAPQLWFELERPFLHGGRTYWRPSAEPFVRVPAAQPSGPPVAPTVVPSCEIADECWPSDRVPTPDVGYCNMDGVRFCEAGIHPS